MKNKFKILFFAVFYCLTASSSFIYSQTADDKLQGFDEYVINSMKDWKVNGTAVEIIKNGEVVLVKGYGYRDADKKLPVTAQTLFAIGSCTKAFTSADICILVDEGTIDLDKPIIEYMPSFKMYDDYVTMNMSPRDLLTHRSGLPRHDIVWYGSDKTRKELFNVLRYLEPTKPFRTEFQYQNIMYMTAGYLVEQITGSTWEDFTKEHIFLPLEMNNTNFSVFDMQKSDDYSLPYTEEKDGKVNVMPFRNIDAMGPAGSINSSVTDMANWVKMQLANGKYKDKQIISDAMVSEMHTPFMTIKSAPTKEVFFQSYGLGWFITNYRGHIRIEHGGNIDGFSASVCLLPADSLGIVVLCNMNETSVPSIIRNTAIDKMLGMEDLDWNKRLYSDIQKRKEKAKEDIKEEVVKQENETEPSHPIKEYTGKFEHPAYGILTITMNDDKLNASLHGLETPLKHFNYDIFQATVDQFDGLKFNFLTNSEGEISKITLALETGIKDIEFTKVIEKKEVSASKLKKYEGVYEISGTDIKIYLKGSTLYMFVPGQPEYELIPVKENEFKLKQLDGFSAKFNVDSDGNVTELVSVQPNGSFVCRKK